MIDLPKESGRKWRYELTPRQLLMARMAASGKANKEISAEFGVSLQTVKYTISRIYRKLGWEVDPSSTQRVKLVRWAIAAGLLCLLLAANLHAATPTIQGVRSCSYTYGPVTGGSENPTITAFTCELPAPTLSGNFLAWWMQLSYSGTAPTITVSTDKSDTFTKAVLSAADTNGPAALGIWAVMPTAGSRYISVTFSGTTTTIVAGGVAQWNNVTSATADATNSHINVTGTAATAGSITPTQNGDLVLACFLEDSQFSWTSFATGSNSNITWEPLGSDRLTGMACEWGQDSAMVAINPAATLSPSVTYEGVVAAFKTSATGTANSGFYILGMQSHNTYDQSPSSVTLQQYFHGNFIGLAKSAINTYEISSISDTCNGGLTWTKITGAPVVNVAQSVNFWYATNTGAACYDTITLTMNSGGNTGNSASFWVFDIVGAGSSPIDTSFGTSGLCSGTGNNTTTSDVTAMNCATSAAGEIVLGAASLGENSATKTTIAPTGLLFMQGNYNDPVNTPNSYPVPTTDDENDWIWSYTSADSASHAYTFSHNNNTNGIGNGVGNWAVGAFAVKSATATTCVPSMALLGVGRCG